MQFIFMHFKQPDSRYILKPVHHNLDGKNGNVNSVVGPPAAACNKNISENQLMARLMGMQELNAHLESLVEQRTKELNEVAATNTKFVSIIAHDLRSPFSSIIGALDLLKESLTEYDMGEIQKFVEIASNAANRTLTLLDNLLAWTISQNKEKCFNPVKINLHELLASEIENINISAKQKLILLNHSVSPDLHLTADLQMVKTILRNLIGNAIKYTKNGGEITISASESKPFIEIAVKDNGVGISKDDLQKLFKLDKLQSTKGTCNEYGTGLGLLLCKEFVEMHHGNIVIESEPGKGSEFKIRLPNQI